MITAMPRIAIAVHDFDAAVSTFREAFGMPVLDFSDTTVPALGAHVGMCVPRGGSNVELMAPANPDLALSQALQKFLDSRDEGLYALMLEAPDPDIEAERLLERGLGVLPLMKGAGGRDVHPRSTSGVLVRVYPENSVGDVGDRTSREPGLGGIDRVIVATRDAEASIQAYRDGFALETDAPTEDAGRGVTSVRCRAPEGGDIELVSALDPEVPFAGAIERFVSEKGEGMFALMLGAEDRHRAAEMLTDRGIDLEEGPVGPEVELFGTRIVLSEPTARNR